MLIVLTVGGIVFVFFGLFSFDQPLRVYGMGERALKISQRSRSHTSEPNPLSKTALVSIRISSFVVMMVGFLLLWSAAASSTVK